MADFLGIDLSTLDPAQTRAAVAETLVEGTAPSRWWRRQSQSFRRGVMDKVREGMQRGFTNSQIARDLRDTVYPRARNQANALAATSIDAVSNKARVNTFRKNDDVIKGYQQVSTLDSRTSDVCISYSGMAWTLDGEPIDGALPFNGGPPRHFNCRSTLVPVLKSFEELGFDEPDFPPMTRASIDGQVPGDITFDKFLRGKSKAFQDETLGPARAQLWRDDRITLRELVDMRGNPLTVNELMEKAAKKTAKPRPMADPAEAEFTTPSAWFKKFNDPDVTPDEIIFRATPEQRRQINLFEKKIEAGVATDKLHRRPDGSWDPERVKLVHDRIINDIFSFDNLQKATPPPGSRPVVTFLGGRGGSGKSFLTQGRNAPANVERSIVLNSDDIKEMLPEYKGWNAAHVHEESSYLFKQVLKIAQDRRVNVVLDVTLANPAKASRQLDEFLEAGFDAEGFYMHLPRQEAAFRAIGRATKADNPRYVPLDIILGSDKNEEAFEALIGRFRRWGMWDNQVPRGSDPRFLGGNNLDDALPGHGPRSLPGERKYTTTEDWRRAFDDPDITAEQVMARASDEAREAVARFERQLAEGVSTEDLHKVGGEWKPARVREVHDDIYRTYFSADNVRKATPRRGEQPVVTVLGGRGGSGKSFLTEGKNAPADTSRAIVLNSDDVKEMIPEYKGWNAGLVHEESSELYKTITKSAMDRKLNVVLDITLGNPEKVARQIDEFIAAGYRVEGYYMHLPRQEAALRAIGRATKPVNPRYVPLDIILSSTRNEAGFDALKPKFERWGVWDNQVDRGEEPRFLAGEGLDRD